MYVRLIDSTGTRQKTVECAHVTWNQPTLNLVVCELSGVHSNNGHTQTKFSWVLPRDGHHVYEMNDDGKTIGHKWWDASERRFRGL